MRDTAFRAAVMVNPASALTVFSNDEAVVIEAHQSVRCCGAAAVWHQIPPNYCHGYSRRIKISDGPGAAAGCHQPNS